MVGNALLRGGAQINFWQSKSGTWEGAHPLLIDTLAFGLLVLQKVYGRTEIVGPTKQLDQRHQVLWLFQSFDHPERPLNARAYPNKLLLSLERAIGRSP